MRGGVVPSRCRACAPLWLTSERGRPSERAASQGRHTVVEALGAAAAAWGVLMAISPLLQIRRMIVRRSSADVSIAYLLVLEFGFFLWIAYGVVLGNPFIAFPNSVAAIVGAITMAVAWTHRHGARAGE